jgi:hypothetical protein
MPLPDPSPRLRRAVVAAGLTATALLLVAADTAPAPEVAYPDGFRAWAHVTSGLIDPGSPAFARYGGLHSIYANRKALAGYRTGRFPDGSVLVFDVFALAEDAANHASGPTERKLTDVMVKDSARYAATGGWGYGEFKGSSRTERSLTQAQAPAACHSCHATQAKTDYVFSHDLGAKDVAGPVGGSG